MSVDRLWSCRDGKAYGLAVWHTRLHRWLCMLNHSHPAFSPSPHPSLPVPPLCVPLGVEANFGHVTAFNVTTDAKLMRFLRRYRVTFTVIDFLDDDDEVRGATQLDCGCHLNEDTYILWWGF